MYNLRIFGVLLATLFLGSVDTDSLVLESVWETDWDSKRSAYRLSTLESLRDEYEVDEESSLVESSLEDSVESLLVELNDSYDSYDSSESLSET